MFGMQSECEESRMIVVTMREGHRAFEVTDVLNVSSCHEICSGTRDCSLAFAYVLLVCVATIVPIVLSHSSTSISLLSADMLMLCLQWLDNFALGPLNIVIELKKVSREPVVNW